MPSGIFHFLRCFLPVFYSESFPKFFKLNGAIYIVKRDYFIKKKKFVSENSNYYLMENKDSINLDTKNDLILYKNFLKKIK